MAIGARTWLVTGASSGRGRAIAEAALAAGDTVVGVGRRASALESLVAVAPDRVVPCVLDVADTASVPAAVDQVLARTGRIDVVVNAAGRALIGAVEETTDDELRSLMDVHLHGPAALVRAVLPGMRERGSGAIVQITSMGGRMSFPGVGAYSATKFALEGLSEALAAEVAPFGVRVLIVEPGAFRTGLHGPAMQESAELEAYREIVGPGRAAQAAMRDTEPGDPARAAAAILAALDAENPPLRLLLGTDAFDAVAGALDTARDELTRWEHTSRGTDFPEP